MSSHLRSSPRLTFLCLHLLSLPSQASQGLKGEKALKKKMDIQVCSLFCFLIGESRPRSQGGPELPVSQSDELDPTRRANRSLSTSACP